jgi:hypothetical protein
MLGRHCSLYNFSFYITGCNIQVDGGAMAGIEIRMISDWIRAK